MDKEKREFLLLALKIGGVAVVYNLLPFQEAEAFMLMVNGGVAPSGGGVTLVSRWEFDSDLTDMEATGNDLTANDASPYNTTTFFSGTAAIDGDGINDYWFITDVNQTNLDGTDPSGFTVPFWHDYVIDGGIVNKHDGTNGYEIRVTGNRALIVKLQGTEYQSADFMVNSGGAHYNVTFDPSVDELRVYEAGIEQTSGDFPVTSATETIVANTADFEIARRQTGTGFNGSILDDMRFYIGAMNDTEALALYNSY